MRVRTNAQQVLAARSERNERRVIDSRICCFNSTNNSMTASERERDDEQTRIRPVS